jgi:hypothetical protein
MSGSSGGKGGQNITLNPNKLEDGEISEAAIRMYGRKNDKKPATNEISTKRKSLGPKPGNETTGKKSDSAKTQGKRTKKVIR